MTADQQFWLAVLAQISALAIGLVTLWYKVQDVHKSVNGRMDELVAATAKASRAEGAALATQPLPPAPPEVPPTGGAPS